MQSTHMIGGTPSVVRRFRLTEGSPITLPANCERLYSEIVADSEGVEILELWLAVPVVNQVAIDADTQDGPQTIYTSTVVYDDDEELEDDEDFAHDIEQRVSKNLREYEGMDDDNGDY